MYYFVWYKYSNREANFDYKRNSKKLLRTCEECGTHNFEYAEPVIFNIVGELCDFYMVNGLTMISEKFLDILRESGFVGYKIRNAVVGKWDKAKSEDEVEALKYYELIVNSRCGLLRNLEGKELPHCKTCGKRMLYTDILTEGVSFNKESYDGSDIFSFENWHHVLVVTDKVKKVLMKNKLTNLKFIPLNEKVFDERVSDTLKEKWIQEGKVSDTLKAIWNSNPKSDAQVNMQDKNMKIRKPKTENFFIPKKFKEGSYTLSQLEQKNADSIKLTYEIGGGFDQYLFLYIPEFGTKTSICIPRENVDNLAVTYDMFDVLKSVYASKDGKEYLMYINFKSEAERRKKLYEFTENESRRIFAKITELHSCISAIVMKHYYDGLSVGYSIMIETVDENGENDAEEYIDCNDYDFAAILSCTNESKRDRYFLIGDTEFTEKMKTLMSGYKNKTDSFKFLVETLE